MKRSEVVSDVHFTVTITHSMSLSQWVAVWPEVLAGPSQCGIGWRGVKGGYYLNSSEE